jgi:hypothetical protein
LLDNSLELTGCRFGLLLGYTRPHSRVSLNYLFTMERSSQKTTLVLPACRSNMIKLITFEQLLLTHDFTGGKISRVYWALHE